MADPAEETADQQDDDSPRGLRARIEEQAARAREASEKATKLERENVLLKAGLGDLSERRQKALFADLGETELSVDALKAAAKDLFGDGATGSPTAPPPPAANDADVEEMERFSAGGTSVEPPPPEKQVFITESQNFQGSRAEYEQWLWEKNKHLLDS